MDVLKPYKGGEELRRAAAALAGPAMTRAATQDAVESAATQAAMPPLPVALPQGADASVRELAFVAQQYAKAAALQPEDFEATYNHALALQELASHTANQADEPLRLLQQACDSYGAAHALRPASHAALYNWGVALSDMARLLKAVNPGASYDLLLAATDKYGRSLKYNPNNPQALNNWGLVLQELTALRPPSERAFLVDAAVSKFRRAVRLRPDFDRACYNLGTVCYAHASALDADDAGEGGTLDDEGRAEEAMHRAFSLAAQYIALAYALQPGKDVYAKSIQVVSQLLPLPHLRCGFLLAADPDRRGAVDEAWASCWFVLDHASLRTAPVQQRGGAERRPPPWEVAVPLADVEGVRRVSDPSLPPGAAFWVRLHSRPQGLYLVCSGAAEAEGWVDALHLLSYLAAHRQLGALHQALTTAAQRSQPAPWRP